jgi:cell pole-organizing protein PopZ
MSAQPKANEPSMEEILASIRKIIADDEKPAAPAEEAAPEPVALAPQPEPEPEPELIEDDVLDLGAEAERVEEEALAPVAEPVDDVDFAESQAAAQPETEPEPPQAFVPPPVQPQPVQPQPAPPMDMAALISDQTGAAVQNAFGALANTVLSNNARTLEDLVKEMLKPMLKTWLDDNLPGMVERLVRAEIERVARGGRR